MTKRYIKFISLVSDKCLILDKVFNYIQGLGGIPDIDDLKMITSQFLKMIIKILKVLNFNQFFF